MNSDNSALMRKAKEKFEKLYDRCVNTKWSSCSEQDTLTKFIHPLLEALGWNICDFDDMREEVLAKLEGRDRHIDIVLYFRRNPYIGIEVKGLSFGSILHEAENRVNERCEYLFGDLLQKSKFLKVKYAVLTRFAETIIFDPSTSEAIATFRSLNEHIEKFDILWNLLSKPKT
ncbi:MAG: hypothetical protein QXK18_03550 [Candidatus Bathyarchaeia archaeon]